MPSTLDPTRPPGARLRHPGFAGYAWGVTGYTMLVILWGVYVRAAGAGNGCGDNWPLCDGQILPRHPGLKMLIEFLHRASSGVDGLLIAGLLAGAVWLYPRRHRVRRAAGTAAVLVVVEALLGAALVLFGWVGTNASPARIAADGLHLVNTLLLLAAVLLTTVWASGWGGIALRPRGTVARLGAALGAVAATAVFGVMAALADTLYPSATVAAGVRLDFAAQAPVLDRLRVLHPLLAVATGLYLLYLGLDGLPAHASRRARRLGQGLALAVVVQWAVGAADMLRLAPAGMQVLHLFCADLLWLLLVAFAVSWLEAAPGQC